MSSLEPLVTVYLVNHNYGKYIESAITSVLSQTINNYELIIIDDGSSDNSKEIIEKFMQHEKVYVIYQKNKGLNVTNNIAIRASKGKYIMRLDADDYLDENAISVMSGVLDRNPDVSMVFPDYYLMSEKGDVQEIVRRHDFQKVELYDQPPHGACTMIRRECLIELGGYDETYRCQDSWDLWMKFIEQYKVKNVNLPLFYYRQHVESLTNNEDRILATRAQIIRKRAKSSKNKINCIAIVPIRGHMTDPNYRALRVLGNKPLLEWTLDTVLETKRISKIYVTTPDDKIASHVKNKYEQKIQIIERDWRLALPNSSLNDTLTHLFKLLPDEERKFSAIIVLFIESPFRGSRCIDTAIDFMEVFQTDRVIGVRPETDRLYRHNGKGMFPVQKSNSLRLESEEIYRQVGEFTLFRRGQYYDRDLNTDTGKVGHIFLDQTSAMHVSSEFDWRIAEMYAEPLSR